MHQAFGAEIAFQHIAEEPLHFNVVARNDGRAPVEVDAQRRIAFRRGRIDDANLANMRGYFGPRRRDQPSGQAS